MILKENVITSTVAVDGNIIEKVDRYVYLGKTVTQAGDPLPEIKRCIELGWAAFSKVANIMKSRKASMKIKRKIHNEYVLPVMVYGSETWALNNYHMELLHDVTTNIIPGFESYRCKWHHIRYQEGNTRMGGTHCTITRQHMGKQSDRVDTTRMDKTKGKTESKTGRQPYLPTGSCVVKNNQRSASVVTVQERFLLRSEINPGGKC